MAALRQLARTSERARRLLALDERYAPFTRWLLDLALRYHSTAIVALVEKAPERGRPG